MSELHEKLAQEDKCFQFLQDKAPDLSGLFVHEYLLMTEYQMEIVHDWVQHAFPINTPSIHNPDAPLYFGIIKYDNSVLGIQGKLVAKYMESIGLYQDEHKDAYGNPTSYIRMDADKFYRVVDQPYNHHIKRISRLLKNLMLSQRQTWMPRAIYRTLVEAELTHRGKPFTSYALAYWSSIVLEFDDQLREAIKK